MLDDSIGFLGRLHQKSSLPEHMGTWLLQIDILAGTKGWDGHVNVPVMGCRDYYGVD